MRKTWKKVIALSLVAAMAVSAAGCSKSGQTSTEGGSAQTQAGSKETEAGGSTGGSGEYKDTVVWAQGADVTSLDPHQGKETPAVEVTDQIFDTLTVVDAATGELQPQIAESWDQNSDTSYTFHIRQGVKFHDGSEVKAEDVKFSLDRAINSAAVSYIVDFIDKVDVVDDYTVNVELKASYAPALRNLSVPFAAIVPKAVVEADEEAFKLHPIGTGPYKFVEWKQGDSVTLERFDDYYAGPAETQKLVMKVIPEASQRTIALETGEVDLAYDLLPNDLEKVRSNSDLQLFEAPSLTCYYISMNMNKAPYDDQKVRDAVNYAIDRQLIIDTIASGSGEPADAIIAPAVFGYFSPGAYEYDPEKAKGMVEAAGWDPNRELEVLVSTGNEVREKSAILIQQDLQKIGIKTKIQTLDFPTLLTNARNGDYDLCFIGSAGSVDPSESVPNVTAGYMNNFTQLTDPTLGEVGESGAKEITFEARKAVYDKYQEILFQQMPMAFLYFTNDLFGYSDKLENVRVGAIDYNVNKNVWAWKVNK